MSASWCSSSGGPVSARRSYRFSSEISRVREVIVRSGASTRPATTHPSSPESSAINASAMNDSISS